MIQAKITVTSDAVIAARVQNSDTHETKLSILGTLPSGIGGREVSFVEAIGCRNDICGGDGTAVLVS